MNHHPSNRDNRGYSSRVSTFIQKVPFGNTYAFQIESDLIKGYIVEQLLRALIPSKDETYILKQFPKKPKNGRLNAIFEYILRYTYLQHNYILFLSNVEQRFVKFTVFKFFLTLCLDSITKISK